jgi:site-specific DNA-methyltransferase (adenine-specific)
MNSFGFVVNVMCENTSDFMEVGEKDLKSRFIYCAKTSSRERNEGLEGMPLVEGGFKNDSGRGIARDKPYEPVKYKNNHPTVKPLKLMRYLITLVMPPKDGILLDPFAGSGSTIIAAHQLGVKAIGIEKQAEYVEIAKKRLQYYKDFKDDVEPDLFEKVM